MANSNKVQIRHKTRESEVIYINYATNSFKRGMFLKTVNAPKNIFELPQLEVHMNFRSVQGLAHKLSSLEDLSNHRNEWHMPGKEKFFTEFHDLFTEILQELKTKLAVHVPDFALDSSRISWEGRGSDRIVKRPVYARQTKDNHLFFMVVDFGDNRLGFWDTTFTQAQLSLDTE